MKNIQELKRNFLIFSFDEVQIGDKITYNDYDLLKAFNFDIDIVKMQLNEIERRHKELECTVLSQKNHDGQRILSFV